MGTGEYPPLAERYRRADRRHRLRAAGHPRGHPAHGAAARGGPARGRERLRRAPCRPRATRPRRRCCADVFEVDRPDLARHRHDPRQRLAALRARTRDFDAEQRFDVGDIRTDESPLCRSRRGAAGADQAARVRGLRHGVHAAQPARRHDGVLRGRLRGLLPLPPAGPRRSCRDARRPASTELDFEGWTCPLPLRNSPTIVMGHGGGGALSAELVEHLFLPAFGGAARADAGRLGGAAAGGGAGWRSRPTRYVVQPMFFPGGSIGDLAVNGTVNDLAMVGRGAALPVDGVHPRGGHADGRRRPDRRPRWARPPRRPGCQLVTGDTKVVDHGHGDGIYVNTAGIGLVPDGVDIGPHRARPGRRRSSSAATSACTAWP